MLMPASCLTIAAHGSRRELWLVPTAEAMRFVRSHQRLPPRDAVLALFGANLDDVEIARFIQSVGRRRSPSGNPLHWQRHMGRAELERLVERGLVAVLDRVAEADANPALREQRRLARELTELVRHLTLIPGRRCRFVAGDDYANLPNRDRFHVVRHDEAKALLSGASGNAPGHARELLARAASLLAPDWRLPQTPDGLIMLREIPQVAADTRSELPLTPSQLRALAQAEKKIKLEVVVLGVDDKLLEKLQLSITMPDDETHESDLGGNGKVKVASAKNGTARVTLTWADTRGK
jgi:hypothetical protein